MYECVRITSKWVMIDLSIRFIVVYDDQIDNDSVYLQWDEPAELFTVSL